MASAGTGDARTELISFLVDQGVAREEVEAAAEEGFEALQLLASDRMLIGGVPRYTAREVASRAGVTHELAERFWRALGFPDAGEAARVFTDDDVAMLAAAASMIELGVSDEEVALQLTRVMGLSLARVAESQVGALRSTLDAAGREAAMDEEQIAVNVVRMANQLLPTLERFLLYTWRRHLAAAARRHTLTQMGHGEPGVFLVVGFVDMVGFTALSQQLEDRELGAIVERFEGLAYDTVAAAGGRVVKWIGDAVMFVTEEPVAAVEIGLRLAEVHASVDDLPEVAVGIAAGEVLPREGDYIGPVVNLASRVVSVARAGTVVVSETVRNLLRASENEDYVWRPIRPRTLKGIGRVRLWKLARAIPDGASDEEPRALRAARTREAVEDVLEDARELVGQVGPKVERIEEAIAKVKRRRRSDRTPPPGRS